MSVESKVWDLENVKYKIKKRKDLIEILKESMESKQERIKEIEKEILDLKCEQYQLKEEINEEI